MLMPGAAEASLARTWHWDETELESALRVLEDPVLRGPLLTLSADMETPLLIFIDGAWEGEDFKQGSVGRIFYCIVVHHHL